MHRAAAFLLSLLLFTSCAEDRDPTPESASPSPSDGLVADAPGVGIGEVGSRQSETDEPESVETIAPVTDANADFYPDGIFLYGDAVYTQAFFSETNARYYAQTALYYAQLFGCRVSTVIAPLSSMTIDNPKVTSVIPDQREILDGMRPLFDASVNFVNPYEKLYAHRTEYLYFHTDHHWTQLGAYYAYAAFAESMGWTPTPLSSFAHAVTNPDYAGSMYQWTMDERVKGFHDEIEVYYPTKPVTMTVETPQGDTLTYDTCIVNTNNTYVTFIAGDNPYTYINIPDNPQNLSCLVLKDSFGNAFVPFLCEHYGNIVVVDTRYVTENLFSKFAGYGFSDILFINNIEAANSYDWPKFYMAAVGVQLP